MANLKISELAAGTLPMSGAELVAVVQGGATVRVPANALKGDTGEPGPKGDTGEPGPKGDTGDTGSAGPTTWAGITDKPDVIAAGADAVEARTAIGAVADSDPRLSDPRTPTGGAGGVLSGTYPNPGFAVDMATQAELDLVSSAKVDKVAGKGLSSEDYTTAEKNKLAGVATGATANATDAQLRDRATHTGAQAISTVTGLQGALDAKAPLASPALTGVPSAPTAAVGTNTTQLATTAFSKAQIAADAAPAAHVGSGGAAHANAVASGAAGFMTGADKTKLDGIATGANNYTHPANHPPSIITQDASNRFVTDAEKTAWNAKEPAIAAGTTAQYRRGDKTWQPVADLPVSTAQAAAIATATAIHPFLLIGA